MFLPLLEIEPRFVERPPSSLVTTLTMVPRRSIPTQHITTYSTTASLELLTNYLLTYVSEMVYVHKVLIESKSQYRMSLWCVRHS